MIVNLAELKRIYVDVKVASDFLDEIVNNAHIDPPYLSALIASQKGGEGAAGYVMEALHSKYIDDRNMPNEMRAWWNLKVIVDEWGNPPRPGGIVHKRQQLKLRHKVQAGDTSPRPLTSNEESVDIMNGEWAKKWLKFTPYKIDEKGCIRCEFDDASHFLSTRGIHATSGAALCQHTQAHTSEPAPAPNGQLLHKHYHQFKEMDAEEYAALPIIKPTDEPLRGIDPMDKIKEWDALQKAIADQKLVEQKAAAKKAAKVA